MSLKNKLALLRKKVESGKAPAPKVDKYAKLKRVAEEEPEELGSALGELTEAFVELAEAADALRDNLDLGEVDAPAENDQEEESVTERSEKTSRRKKKASKKFASSLRKLALEAPGSLAEALQEVYSTLDSVAEGIENLAQNLGIELQAEPLMDMDTTPDMGMGGEDLGAPPPPPDMGGEDLGGGVDLDADIDQMVQDNKASSRRPLTKRPTRR